MFVPCIADAAGSGHYSIIKKYDDETTINYDKIRKPKHWYLDVRADLSFLSWKNEYTYGSDSSTDKFSFKPVVGVDLAVGIKIGKSWRTDFELGYLGTYSETETEYITNYITEKTEFNLSTFYATFNGYYDFYAGFYAGLGAGVALVQTSLDHSALNKVSKTNASPMGAAMLGWMHPLNDKLNLDVRYRFAAFSGSELDYLNFRMKIGLITDNSVSIGLKYAF